MRADLYQEPWQVRTPSSSPMFKLSFVRNDVRRLHLPARARARAHGLLYPIYVQRTSQTQLLIRRL